MRMIRPRAGAALLAVTLFSSGCTEVIVTRRATIGGVSEGVTYFLPKRLHQVTVKTTLVQVDDESVKKARDAVVAAATVLKVLQTKVAELEPQVAMLKAAADAIPAESPAKADAVKKMDSTTGELGGAKLLVQAAASTYEKALVRVGELESENAALKNGTGIDALRCQYDAEIKIIPLKLVPDDRYPFVAKLNHSPFHDDKLVLRTTPEGLLTGATGESADRTGDIIIALAQTATMFMTGIPFPSQGVLPLYASLDTPPKKEDGNAPTCTAGTTIERIVDLASTKERDAINESLKVYSLRIEPPTSNLIPIEETPCDPDSAAATMAAVRRGHLGERKDAASPTAAGLVYRRDLPYQLTFSACRPFDDDRSCDPTSPSWRPIVSQLVFLPQRSPISQIGFTSGLFRTSNADLAFSDGMLVSMDTKRPSEILGVVNVPLNVARGMTSIITEIISLKVDYATKDAAYAEQQLALAKSLAELAKLKGPTLPAPTNPPTTSNPPITSP